MAKINGSMVVMAREFRGLTQEELARKMFVSQARIAKLESDIQNDLQGPMFESLCNALDFPAEFFNKDEDLLGFGSSAYFYRKKADLSAADRRRIHGLINLLRINLKTMLAFVDIDPARLLPRLDIDDYGGSAENIAQAVRSFWSMPDGPVKNLTTLIESAGIIIIPCEFSSKSMDATSMRLAEMPPMIFINTDVSGDRWRFTLAHELGHLVMHDLPKEEMEDEADRFAAEFLMPEVEMSAQFSRLANLRLQDLANLKMFWKTSMAALLMRASDLGFLSDNQKRYLWASMSKMGYRTQEPQPIEKEVPKTYKKILRYFTTELQYSMDELSKTLHITRQTLEQLYGSFFSESKGPRLRVVS